jgi:hypothetical protein
MDATTAQPAARYRAISWAAVASLGLGAGSLLVFLGWIFAVIPLAALVLGWRALRQIARTPEEFTGQALAWTGIGLAVAASMAGCAWLLLARFSEVPIGYQRVEYAELQPNANVPNEKVPPAAIDFDGKKVYVKGYMVPSRQQTRLTRFFLCPTNGDCTFCFPNPKPTEIILVNLTSDLVTDYTTRLIGLGGRFHVDPDSPSGLPYSMEADRLK